MRALCKRGAGAQSECGMKGGTGAWVSLGDVVLETTMY
jgi:hypothetical protein